MDVTTDGGGTREALNSYASETIRYWLAGACVANTHGLRGRRVQTIVAHGLLSRRCRVLRLPASTRAGASD